jgi:hypothetical protein
MIGLPGETDADVLGIAETVRWLQQECRIKGRRPLIVQYHDLKFHPQAPYPIPVALASLQSEFLRKQATAGGRVPKMRGPSRISPMCAFRRWKTLLGGAIAASPQWCVGLGNWERAWIPGGKAGSRLRRLDAGDR